MYPKDIRKAFGFRSFSFHEAKTLWNLASSFIVVGELYCIIYKNLNTS